MHKLCRDVTLLRLTKCEIIISPNRYGLRDAALTATSDKL